MADDTTAAEAIDAPAAPDTTGPADPNAPKHLHWTAGDVRDALRKHFGGMGAVVMEEVGNGTGHSANRRWADMLVMETWPSRGLTITGVEIKVSRSDWQHERAHPEKAEEMHQHCDHWFLAAARGVVADVAEVPARWGFLELTRDLAGRPKLVLVRGAAREPRKPEVNRMVVAAMLRAVQRQADAKLQRDVREEVARQMERHIAADRARRTGDAETSAQVIADLRAMLGPDGLHDWLRKEDVIRAIAFVHKSRIAQDYGALDTVVGNLRTIEGLARNAVDDMRAAAEAVGLALPILKTPRRRKGGAA